MLVGNEVDIVEEVRKATGDPLSACLLCIILLCEKSESYALSHVLCTACLDLFSRPEQRWETSCADLQVVGWPGVP